MITARKKQAFTQWIGIKKVEKSDMLSTLKMVICISFVFVALSVFILYMIRGTATATTDFDGMGIVVLPAGLIYAFFNTAFPEELLFRGFLLKRLKNKCGFNIANIIQSVIFSLLHGAMFISYVGIIKVLLIIVFTAIIAWFMGYTNEVKADGSNEIQQIFVEYIDRIVS
ncbi:MAG: CPBP family intramembrane metalloprotease [Desulfitobacteriaceae bacterium]|nr:CPBP family intramembrane metalloprotease [Desulfitobacteriaceae bacterium]MDD4346800.1 CPBP family intramembrane metalloprotease [Desulfitobacteriaceae bacterium]MDD4402734.1 CPBP family intramembrane metalloprotease [Desulfitobacteriaceae bacterium]